IILEGNRPHGHRDSLRPQDRDVGKRAGRILPWVLLRLHAAGISSAWHYRHRPYRPPGSGSLPSPPRKSLLATTGFARLATARIMHARKRLCAVRLKWIHISLFIHVLLFVFLAKAMFY